jgi:hypothetical protein
LDGVPFFVHTGRLDPAVQIPKQCIELQIVLVTDLTLSGADDPIVSGWAE